MKKIISLFKRDYKGDHLVYDEVVEGAEWVLAGEGQATVKMDGTCCLWQHGQLYKRHDRKLTKKAHKARKAGQTEFTLDDFKPAPIGWIACEPEPTYATGHWPGWVAVGEGPEDQYHREALEDMSFVKRAEDGTYELIGPKIQGNPYGCDFHMVWP